MNGIDDLRLDPQTAAQIGRHAGDHGPAAGQENLLDVFRTESGTEIVDRTLDLGTDRIGIDDQSLTE